MLVSLELQFVWLHCSCIVRTEDPILTLDRLSFNKSPIYNDWNSKILLSGIELSLCICIIGLEGQIMIDALF